MPRRETSRRWQGWDREVEPSPVIVRQGPVREAPPMTPRQAALLKRLCEANGEKFNAGWTKAQASKRIAQLKARG